MNKTYISSLLVVLLAGVQVISVQGQEFNDMAADDAMMAQSTEASVEEADIAVMQSDEEAADISPEVLVEKGIDKYEAGEYDEARLMFEAALAVDQYNKKAMSYLRKVAAKTSALNTRKLKSVRASLMADVYEKWTPEFTDALASLEERGPEKPDPTPPGVLRMQQRMQEIQIPSLDFRDANIKDVVLFLTEACRRMDPTGKGVNMVLLGLSSSDAMGAQEGNNITISIRDLSLYDALKVIVEMASLRFEVDENMVMIMPADYVRRAEIQVQTFSVNPEVGDELSSMAGGGDSGDSMDDLFGGGDTMSMAGDAGPVDVSGYFTIVNWPEGSSATYYPNFRKLIVKNTKENLSQVKAIVDNLEDEAIARRSSQVEIEAKFVEFSDGSLSELGFDWNIYGSGHVGGFELVDGSTYQYKSGYNDAGVPTPLPPAGDLFIDPVRAYTQVAGTATTPAESLFGGGHRTGSSVYEVKTSGLLSSMGGVVPSMLFSDGTVDMQISAMEQNGTADILSSPKVTTQSGYEAVIRVTEIHRYPQDWDVETGQRTAPVVKPQDWEDFDLGVVLRVTPEVDIETNTIKLELNPEIRKFIGFDEYYVAQNSYDQGTTDTVDIGGDGSLLFARMPFFETRSVQTRVTVADGSTVMMGGLVDESTETFRDQVPILGDIPYIGRLFRTEGSRSAKKNLVIFVKATQVDEKGMTRLDREMARQSSIAQ